jgi:signal transduction histidine kinase
LVEETIKLMRNEAILKEINLEVHCGGNNCTVSGDEIHLKQVLVNIIKNAIEATPKHGRIDLSLELTERNTVLIIVKDNGAGIRKQDLDKIGTPFFTTKPSGTGLGLSVSKRIIEEHRGTFDIKSRPGKGATVIIELPLSNTEG